MADKQGMNSSLARYHSRAPRYILQPQDNTLVRVAGPQQTPWEEGTEIKNISLSGLVFTAPAELCPIVGEFIKIQFQVPGQQQMACFGLVSRLEGHGKSEMLVGAQFYKLEMPHRIALLQGLAQRLKDQIQQEAKFESRADRIEIIKQLGKNKKALLFMATFLIMWMALTIFSWR